jgi:hypothetical protein
MDWLDLGNQPTQSGCLGLISGHPGVVVGVAISLSAAVALTEALPTGARRRLCVLVGRVGGCVSDGDNGGEVDRFNGVSVF